MLGDELRTAREKAGLTQEQLALRAHVDRSYLSEIERGRKSPTVQLFLKVCRAMDASASSIIERIETESPARVHRTGKR